MDSRVSYHDEISASLETALETFFADSVQGCSPINWKEVLESEEILILCMVDLSRQLVIDHIVYSDTTRQTAQHRPFDFLDIGRVLKTEGVNI